MSIFIHLNGNKCIDLAHLCNCGLLTLFNKISVHRNLWNAYRSLNVYLTVKENNKHIFKLLDMIKNTAVYLKWGQSFFFTICIIKFLLNIFFFCGVSASIRLVTCTVEINYNNKKTNVSDKVWSCKSSHSFEMVLTMHYI